MTKKIKLDTELYEKAKKYAELSGYASVDEFVIHVIEKEISKIEAEGDGVEEVQKRLRGLGYLA